MNALKQPKSILSNWLRGWIIPFAIAALTTGCDLSSKAWALTKLSSPSHNSVACVRPASATYFRPFRFEMAAISIVPNTLELRYTENCAGAFGFLYHSSAPIRRVGLLLGMAFALGVMVMLARTFPREKVVPRIAIALLLGGAIGNGWDRIQRGYVVDFIHAHWHSRFDWPVFNVADVAVTVGIALLLLESIFSKSQPKMAQIGE